MRQGAELVRRAGRMVGVETLHSITEMEWRTVYSTLGLIAEFQDFVSRGFWKPSGNDIAKWNVPVMCGLTVESLIVAHQSHGVDVRLFSQAGGSKKTPLEYFKVLRHDRDPMQGSYQVDFNRSLNANTDLSHQSAKDLEKRGVRSC